MGHCPYSELSDLEEVLDEVRTWERVRERSPGVFYVKSTPFLHFHNNKAGERWADVRCGRAWGPRVDVPAPSTADSREQLRAELRRRHAETLAALGGGRGA
jgi:hypothetical protein